MSIKSRKELEKIQGLAKTIYSTVPKGSAIEELANKIVGETISALAEPLKNCEVGTAKAQNDRHCRFCSNAVAECRGGSNYDCLTCFSRWAQRPYRKEKK